MLGLFQKCSSRQDRVSQCLIDRVKGAKSEGGKCQKKTEVQSEPK